MSHGASFGYGARTSQPWSDFGSYGDRLYGVVICDARGSAVWETWEIRRHDEEPTPRILAWDADQALVVYTSSAPEECQETVLVQSRRRPGESAWWDRGPAGAERREEDTRYAHFPACWAALSPDGRRVGLVSAAGQGLLVERDREEEPRELPGEVLAVDLSESDRVEVLRSDGRWERLEG